jgi:hypothetical protein
MTQSWVWAYYEIEILRWSTKHVLTRKKTSEMSDRGGSMAPRPDSFIMESPLIAWCVYTDVFYTLVDISICLDRKHIYVKHFVSSRWNKIYRLRHFF